MYGNTHAHMCMRAQTHTHTHTHACRRTHTTCTYVHMQVRIINTHIHTLRYCSSWTLSMNDNNQDPLTCHKTRQCTPHVCGPLTNPLHDTVTARFPVVFAHCTLQSLAKYWTRGASHKLQWRRAHETPPFHTKIPNSVSVYSVRTGLETLKRLYD